MLFITNRTIRENAKSEAGRTITFDLDNTTAGQSLYFCERTAPGKYTELTSVPFFQSLRDSEVEQILIFIHGFNNLPENAIFQRAEKLQQLLDKARLKTEVVTIVWPCQNPENADSVVKDYLTDQLAADASSFAFARALAKFEEFQAAHDDIPCLKRMSVLAHSMGNRVYRESMRIWCEEIRREGPPMFFRNSFLIAADIVNESLESQREGRYINMASKNVVSYFASDDLALRASKVINARDVSRRLGHTGPYDMTKVPANVYAVDCDNVNMLYDPLKGHSYFLDIPGSKTLKPGRVFEHIAECIGTSRVPLSLEGVKAFIME